MNGLFKLLRIDAAEPIRLRNRRTGWWALFRSSGVPFNKVMPWLRDIVLVVDRFDGALRNAGLAVDAFIRVDVKHGFVLIKAVTRTDDHAGLVFAVLTGLCDDHGHDEISLR